MRQLRSGKEDSRKFSETTQHVIEIVVAVIVFLFLAPCLITLVFKNTMYFTLLQQSNPLSRAISVLAGTAAAPILSTWSVVCSVSCV